MKKETKFISHLHKSTSRNYLARVNKKIGNDPSKVIITDFLKIIFNNCKL